MIEQGFNLINKILLICFIDLCRYLSGIPVFCAIALLDQAATLARSDPEKRSNFPAFVGKNRGSRQFHGTPSRPNSAIPKEYVACRKSKQMDDRKTV
jgi:hypothetical protein